MDLRNDVRHHANGTTDVLLDGGRFVRIRTGDYSLVARFFWYVWLAPEGGDYAAASVLVVREAMRITMLDLLADPGRFAGCIPARPGASDEGLHHGFFEGEDEKAARGWLTRVMSLYYGPNAATAESLAAAHEVVDGVPLGQVLSSTA